LITAPERDDIQEEIRIALSALKEKDKISFLLFELGGFTVDEIKVIQHDRSSSAVKSRLSRARDKLRKIIDGFDRQNRKGKISGSIENIEMETARIINNIKP